MDKELVEIEKKLRNCNIQNGANIYILSNGLNDYMSVGCFLTVGDKYKNLDELLSEIKNCLMDFKVHFHKVNDGVITIIPSK
jgi:hypothetical protein